MINSFLKISKKIKVLLTLKLKPVAALLDGGRGEWPY
jgi:hypothetical protein